MALGLGACSVLRAGPDPDRYFQHLDSVYGDAFAVAPGDVFSDSMTIIEITDGPMTITSVELIGSQGNATVLGYRLFKNHPINLPSSFPGFPATTEEDGVGAPDAIGATLAGPGPQDPTPDGRARTGDYTLVIGYRALDAGKYSRTGIRLTVESHGRSFSVVLHSFLELCVGDNVEPVLSDSLGQAGERTFECEPTKAASP